MKEEMGLSTASACHDYLLLRVVERKERRRGLQMQNVLIIECLQ